MKPNASRNLPPKAGPMIEALRGLGYTTAGALADIVDNSISALATEVSILFTWDSTKSRIEIVDNGSGMDDSELERAMRLGERSPLEERAVGDLGRFGLGLKTASFSQCRRLTVASRRSDKISCLRWDLDVLARSSDGGWHLLLGPALGSESMLSHLSNRPGTVVMWEAMDRIVTPGFGEQAFLDLIDGVESHLAMVFHRYLAGARPKLCLTINRRPIRPWDPFFVDHPATWSSPIDRLALLSGVVEMQGHVLPHKDKLSPEEYQTFGGPAGWTAQQGFYVYRNERLLVTGDWLGLGHGRPWTKEEPHRLARIRLDIPNGADSEWKIDVRKSIARPPVQVRSRLALLAEDVRNHARKVFAHRGRQVAVAGASEVALAWKVEHRKQGVKYRIDTEHPAVRAVLDEVEDTSSVETMLRVIEETVPVQRIWLDTAEARETPRTGFSGSPPEEIADVLMVLYRKMIVKRGLSPALAREQLRRTEPFQDYPALVMSLPDDPNCKLPPK
jgi:hypothetical protein